MEKIYTYSEIKESKIIYDRKPPAFGVIMTFLTLVFLAVAIVWAVLSPKTYVVKATGLVSDTKKVNVMNSVSGKIKEIRVTEGQAVKTGDLIITIDSYQLELQIAQLQATLDLYEDKIEDNKTLIDFVNGYKIDDISTQANPFDSENVMQVGVYSNAETFIGYVNQSKESATDENPFTQEGLDGMKAQILTQLSVYTNLEQYISEKAKQESQIKMYQDSLSEYRITASCDGIIHLSAGLTIGTMLSQSAVLGTITSGERENLYIDAVISATERSKLKVNERVEIAVSGASQTEFGTITGKVISIDEDSTQTENGQIYYRVKILPDKTELVAKNGNKIELSTGMVGECRIKYDETTWFKWAIEQIVGKIR